MFIFWVNNLVVNPHKIYRIRKMMMQNQTDASYIGFIPDSLRLFMAYKTGYTS